MQYHPDRNSGDKSAHDKYVEINEAYDVLSNADKRQTYDLDGYEALQKGNGAQGNPMDPFAMFRGGGGHMGGRPKGPNAMTEIHVSLEQLYSGVKHVINVERHVLCNKCRGTGAKNAETQTCHVCKGRGHVVVNQQLAPGFNVQMQQPCSQCSGKGKTHKHQCPVCAGKKVKLEKKSLTVNVEPGMAGGERIVFERESEQSPSTTPGDVIVTLKQQPHHTFRRENDNLHTQINVSLKEALLGFSKTVRQLDGRQVPVHRDGTTQPFEVLTVKGEGMPHKDAASIKGDMFVKVNIDFPTALTAAQREAVNKLL